MKKFCFVIFALVVLVGLLWFGWFFIKAFLGSPAGVQAGIISFVAAVGVALYTHSATKKREIEARHFAEKRQAYMHYINLLFGLLHEHKKGKAPKNNQPLDQQQIKQMMDFKKELLIWGSAEVIQAYYQFERACDPETEGYDTIQSLAASNKLFRALRKDLGHDDSILGPADLVGLILKPDSKKELEEGLKNG